MEEEREPTLGERFKERRAAKKISLNEVFVETKINKKFLQAIEDDNFSLIPNQVALRGFLKIYSEYLGIPKEEILSKFDSIKKAEEETKKDAPIKKEKRKPYIPIILIIFRLILLLLFIGRHFR